MFCKMLSYSLRHAVAIFIMPIMVLLSYGCSPSGPIVPIEPTLDSIQTYLFDAHCLGSGCHGPVDAIHGADYSAGKALDNLVYKTSFMEPDYNLIEPGDPDNSLLVQKLEGTAVTASMPFLKWLVPSYKSQAVREWIANMAPTPQPTLTYLQKNVFDVSCAVSGCHTGPTPTAGLNLSAGITIASLVGVSSSQSALWLIKPGDPDNSYLIKKLEGDHTSGEQMPKGGTPLPVDQIAAVRGWISTLTGPRPTISWIQPNIFDVSCAYSGCHDSATKALNLDLSDGNALANMMNIPSTLEPAIQLLVPGNPDNSYIIHKMEDTHNTGLSMPWMAPVLAQDKINAVRDWITDLVDEPLVDGQPVSAYYIDTCSGCHGVNRQGATGPALLPQRLTESDAYYADILLNGKPGTVMPPWPYYTNEEVAALIAFMRSEPDPIALEWTLADVQNSNAVLVNEATLPGSPTHIGNVDNLMLVTEREVRSIAVIDGDTHTLLGHIPASYRAHGYTFDPTSDRWAWNMGRDGWVFKIDLYTLQPVRKVRVGLDSRGIAVSDDGRFIITGNYIPATAVILDAQTLLPVKLIETIGTTPAPDNELVESRVAIVSDVAPSIGSYFIIALKEAGQMWRIDWSGANPTFAIDKVLNVGHILHDGFLSPDNAKFYIASQTDNWMGEIDVANWTLNGPIVTGAIPHPGSGATWEWEDIETNTVYEYAATTHIGEGKVAIWDVATSVIEGNVPTAGAGLFLRAHHSSPYVWADAMAAASPHSITVFEKAPPFNIVKIITDGQLTLHPEFTDDGAFVYVSDWNENVVRVYNAATFVLEATITGITTPTGIFNSSRRLETLGH